MTPPAPVRTLADGRTVHSLYAIPGGSAGTRATLQIMRDIVRVWRKHPMVRDLALQIIEYCPAKAWLCETRSIHEWVKTHIKYVRDVADVETVQTPDVTLRDRVGDCDDHSVLIAALLQSVGHRARFVAVKFQVGGPFVHVFTETQLGPYWQAVETTEDRPVGWRPPGVVRRLIVNL